MQSREPSLTAPVRPTISVMGPHYCARSPFELVIEEGSSSSSSSSHPFTVKGADGKTLFILSRPNPLSFNHRRVLVDADNKTTVCTLCKKTRSLHGRWQVFLGESKKQEHLLFTVKRSTIFPRNAEFHVILAKNTEENNWDFKVERNSFEQSCTFIAAPSTNIAKIDDINNLIARVEANVDYAFIAALLVILDEMN